MKRIILPILGVFLLSIFSAFTPVQAPTAAAWKVDPVHSSVSFSVRHFFSDIVGSFDKFDAELMFDETDLEGSSVNFTVQAASINTNNEKRDGHLQSADFFDAETYPTMTFKSSSFKATEEKGTYHVTGTMTVKDVSQEIEIPIKFLGSMDHPRREGMKIGGFSAEFSIDRTTYKVGSGNFAATTTIGDEVTVKVNLETSSQS
ncbi:MAG: YceI family protein [Bacteroidota bacterium]